MLNYLHSFFVFDVAVLWRTENHAFHVTFLEYVELLTMFPCRFGNWFEAITRRRYVIYFLGNSNTEHDAEFDGGKEPLCIFYAVEGPELCIKLCIAHAKKKKWKFIGFLTGISGLNKGRKFETQGRNGNLERLKQLQHEV